MALRNGGSEEVVAQHGEMEDGSGQWWGPRGLRTKARERRLQRDNMMMMREQ